MSKTWNKVRETLRWYLPTCAAGFVVVVLATLLPEYNWGLIIPATFVGGFLVAALVVFWEEILAVAIWVTYIVVVVTIVVWAFRIVF